jgi:lipopolysaccharide transport system permease protein
MEKELKIKDTGFVKAQPITADPELPEEWDLVIQPKSEWFDLQLKDIWRYRDLLMLFVRRDFVAVWKQTILGPLWFFIQPLLTTLMMVVIFGRVANLTPDGVPGMLFYLSGIVCWNYFAQCLTATSNTFKANAAVFGKVYFPRIVVPLSLVVSNLLKFGVQFLLFIALLLFYYFTTDDVHPNSFMLLTPVFIIIMGVMALGFGILVSSFTTKYRDLSFLLAFAVQLAMYASPVIIPLASFPDKYKWIAQINPMTSIIEGFRYAYLGIGELPLDLLLYSIVFSLVVFFLGLLVFNKVEKSFMDTV